jgi:modulator of FtsH protease HflK
MPWNGNDQHGRRPPDRNDPLQYARDKLKQLIAAGNAPGGNKVSSPLLVLVAAAVVAIIAFYALTFRVGADELGIVLRFGKPDRQEAPGLHFRLPYPIDEVYLPKVTRQNIIEIGLRSGAAQGALAAESHMLTGDENIVDLQFVVFWRIKDAPKYLFNIQHPDITVTQVAESIMREVVGQSNIQPLLTSARQKTEHAVQVHMQNVLDRYGTGVSIDQVQLQKIDPPSQVIDAFRDVQAAATDKARLQNEAMSYASRIVPEARGEAERTLQGAIAYKSQSVAEATGQAARFVKIYEEYQKAPEVTRKRMYLETIERIFSGTNKIIIDGKNLRVVPLLRLDER